MHRMVPSGCPCSNAMPAAGSSTSPMPEDLWLTRGGAAAGLTDKPRAFNDK